MNVAIMMHLTSNKKFLFDTLPFKSVKHHQYYLNGQSGVGGREKECVMLAIGKNILKIEVNVFHARPGSFSMIQSRASVRFLGKLLCKLRALLSLELRVRGNFLSILCAYATIIRTQCSFPAPV